MSSLVTVIIPAFNAQATLAETVRSLLAQSLTDWQAIIVDDGSTDSTPSIASDFAWRDTRIRHIRQPNRGLAGARNRALELADTRYVHFLDADDWLTPLGLERLVQAAEWSGRGAACGSWSLHGADGRPLGVTMPPADQVVGTEHLSASNVFAPHSHVVRRDLIGDLRFDESLRVVEDYDMWIRLALSGVSWSSVDDTVAAYRVRPGSLSKNPRLMLDTHAKVVGTHFAGSDATQSLRRIALFYATSAALSDGALGFAESRAMMRDTLGQPAAFTIDELADAGAWSLLFSRGTGPEQFAESARRWLPRLTDWWAALADPVIVEDAIDALALRAVSPESVAETMLDRAEGASHLVLAGAMGYNGRVIRRVAGRRRVPLELRDDRLPRAGLDRLIDADATVLVAPTSDEPLLDRLPSGLELVRWAPTRADLASRVRDALKPAARVEETLSA